MLQGLSQGGVVARRDRFGRFRGKGGIKPYKSNLAGLKGKQRGKKMSGRKKAVLAVAATATVVGIAYNKRRNIARVTGTDTKVASKLMADARAKRGPRSTPLIALKSPKKGKGKTSNPFAGTIAKQKSYQPKRSSTEALARAEQIVQGRKINRSKTMTNVMTNQARRAVDRI